MWTGDGGAFMRAARSESKRAACHAPAALVPVLRSTPCPREREQGTEVCSRVPFCTVKASRERTSVPCSQAGAANGYSMPSTLRVRLIRPPSSMISRMNGGNG